MLSVLESPRFIVPPLKVTTPINSEYPPTYKLSVICAEFPIFKFFAIPTPPSNKTDPSVGESDCVVLEKVATPLIVGLVKPSIQLKFPLPSFVNIEFKFP